MQRKKSGNDGQHDLPPPPCGDEDDNDDTTTAMAAAILCAPSKPSSSYLEMNVFLLESARPGMVPLAVSKHGKCFKAK